MWPTFPLTHLAALSTLPVHTVQRWKKLKSKIALEPVSDIRTHALSVWTRDPDRARGIQKILRETEDEVRACMMRWFPGVRLGAEMHSWRYTLTQDEPLHFDVYADRVTTPVIRLFVNLDNEPRVWDVGPLDDGTDGFHDQGYKARVLKESATERISFAPGSAWLVDSERRAHAIIYGRRAAMFSFET